MDWGQGDGGPVRSAGGGKWKDAGKAPEDTPGGVRSLEERAGLGRGGEFVLRGNSRDFDLGRRVAVSETHYVEQEFFRVHLTIGFVVAAVGFFKNPGAKRAAD